MFNKVILAGNLTADPELRYTPQGTAVCDLRLAVNQKVKSGEEYKDEVLFINCVVWGKQAENASKYLSKGRGVLVEGRLIEEKWETEGGEKRSKMKVNASQVVFLGGGKKEGADATDKSDGSDIEPF